VVEQHNFWDQIKSSLKQKNVNNHPLQMWFEPTNVVNVEDRTDRRCFQLGVPTELHKYWISQNLFDGICAEISALYSQPFEVEFVVTGQNTNSLDNSTPYLSEQRMVAEPATPNPAPLQTPAMGGNVTTGNNKESLNIDHTFSTFVVGRNNEFAHAASYNIACNPGADNYNPLFICGPTGMGKTHLLNAVGNHIHLKFPDLKIMYVSAERFLNECISSIRRAEMDKFRMRYRERCDILLMDDIQVLGRGEAVQEEFFHTLNDFFGKGQQVIVASDRMPKDIKGLEDRIRTRLEWGLIADIQMPDLETRVAILRYKAEKKGIRLPNEVSNYIAKISKRSIRELEGNLNKVKMFSELQGLAISMDLAKKVLSTHDDTAVITIEEIQKLTADHFRISIRDLCSKSRTKPIVTARQIAMWLMKKHLDKSLVDIARAFGKKDHTTVMNALQRVDNALTKDSEIKKYIDELEGRIHNITGV
jgi:chromosomal replication initiator protein